MDCQENGILSTRKDIIYLELLALRCRRGDREAMEELIGRFERPLFYYLRRLVDNEADAWNLLQETWIRAMGSIGRLRDPKNLAAWLYGIARNGAMGHLRRRYSREQLLDSTADLADVEDSTHLPAFEDAEEVHYGLSRLSVPHRDVLTLFFLQDLTLEQIAEVLGVPVGTVKSRLHYAKFHLKAVLEKEGRFHG